MNTDCYALILIFAMLGLATIVVFAGGIAITSAIDRLNATIRESFRITKEFDKGGK